MSGLLLSDFCHRVRDVGNIDKQRAKVFLHFFHFCHRTRE